MATKIAENTTEKLKKKLDDKSYSIETEIEKTKISSSKGESPDDRDTASISDVNTEPIEFSDGVGIDNTDDYYASGGSGSEREIQALKVTPKTKNSVKSKTRSSKGGTLESKKKQKKVTDYIKPTAEQRRKKSSSTSSTGHQISDSGSDTDPITDSENSDSETTQKASKKKKIMGNYILKYPTRATVKKNKNVRERSSDSDDSEFRIPQLMKKWSDRDTEQYRMGYPGKEDDVKQIANLEFYMNQRASIPDGEKIDVIHKKWWNDHSLLERHHGYIQWLFPIRESGMNWHAQELQKHEADAIIKDKKAHERVLKSYEMMLYFYGIQIQDSSTGELARADNWRERFHHLNRSSHNYLRITRILKSLGEFGYENLKEPFVQFMITESLKEKTLRNVTRSCMDYWVGTVKDDNQRKRLREYALQLGYNPNSRI